MCFSCLRYGHSVFKCFKRSPCNVNNCKRYHNELLHEEKQSSSHDGHQLEPQNQKSAMLIDKSNTNIVLSCQPEMKTNFNEIRILFKIVPLKVFGSQTCIEM